MSWTDKKAVEVIKYLRDKYNIKTFIETGTFKGVNARLHSKNFNLVMTCEKNKDYYKEAKANLYLYPQYKNVVLRNEDSPTFLKKLSLGTFIFYLDAHFYDPAAPLNDKFVVKRELDNMKKFKDSVIIIHDFHNGLGGITYDGVKLDMDLVRNKLKRINKNFFFYTNTLASCDPIKQSAVEIKNAGLEVDFDTLDNLDYMWSTPRLTFRGYLYCLPTKLDKFEMKKLGLREWK